MSRSKRYARNERDRGMVSEAAADSTQRKLATMVLLMLKDRHTMNGMQTAKLNFFYSLQFSSSLSLSVRRATADLEKRNHRKVKFMKEKPMEKKSARCLAFFCV